MKQPPRQRGVEMRRPRFRRAACWSVLACCAPGAAVAQAVDSASILLEGPAPFVHESWTVQDGLPVNAINALVQSRDGYIWVATFDGLVRFDGVRFTVFNSANSPGLPSNRILELREARDGSLWLRTGQHQLVRFHDGGFTHFGPELGVVSRVRALHEDASGVLWVGTDGGLGTIRDERFVAVAPEVMDQAVFSIAGASDRTIFAGAASGAVFRIDDGRAMVLVPPEQLRSRRVNALHVDPEGALWIGTDDGIWRYHDSLRAIGSSRQVLGFRSSPATGEVWILTQAATFRFDGERLVTVLDRAADPFPAERLVPDLDGRMLHTSGPELHRDDERIYTLPARSGGASSARFETITSVVLDHEGSLWLGTAAAGLHRLKPSLFSVISEPEGLSSRNVYAIVEDRAGTVWVGTLGGGINRITNTGVEALPRSHAHPGEALSFHQDRDGRLWIGGGSALGPRVCTLPALQCVQPRPDLTSGLTIRAIHQDTQGALWFGTQTRLFRLLDGVWTSFTAEDGAPEFPVRAFQETDDGALWMGTNGGGLARYHEGRFTHVTEADGLPIDLVRSLYLDADGWLWIGTEGRGLARLDPRAWTGGGRGGRIVSIRTSDGLFDDVIHHILEDDFGCLWMSSNRGIFRVDRHDLLDFAAGRVARVNSTGYTERDGLRNREANGGSQPAAIEASDGRMWFATQDGVAIVDPARVEQNTVPPNVVVEGVLAGTTAVSVTDGVAELGVEQRDVEIQYTALSFLAPANVRFRYRLDPYDSDWVEAGGRRTAFYTGIPPGQYRFRVLASNNDGVWNEQGAELALHLLPRFYETGTFRILVLLSSVLLIGVAFRWRIRHLQARARELSMLVDERTTELREHQQQLAARNAQLASQAGRLQELDHAKSRFFANISHEFRTPLTLILGPLRDMSEGRSGGSDAFSRQIEMMTRNAQRLLGLVNQVLDLARLEGGALTLDAARRDLVALARSVTLSFTPLAERRGIELAFHADEEPLLVDLDTEQMEKVLLNLLSNAFKFTEPDGRVTVTLRRKNDCVLLEVRDTGIGIAPEQLPRIFERFYQADGTATRRHEGTGIGLGLAHELVELHGGEIEASSQPGVGTLFTVRMPLAPAEDATLDGVVETSMVDSQPGGVEPPIPAGAPHASEWATDDDHHAAETDRTTVLIVDDHADVRAYVRSVLEPAFRVLEGVDGREGLDIARRDLPDLIISDVMMPRLDGPGLTRALRDDPATDCIPTILLTARAAADDEVRGLESGADDYIAKPFDAGVLEARVSALIATRRRLRERFRHEGVPEPLADRTPAAPRSEFEERLRTLVEENLTEPDFNPEALANAAGLSYKQLYRHLAAELEATPSRFIRTVRVERAADLLRDGAGTITEVAYSVGFNSLSYFYRCFHERFGIAPSGLTESLG